MKWFTGWLCRIGLHSWGQDSDFLRYCTRCSKLQAMFYSGDGFWYWDDTDTLE